MHLEHKYQGDHGSVGEELLTSISNLEEKGDTVEKAVKEGYFNLQEALAIYSLNEFEYVTYLLLKNNGRFKSETKEKQMISIVSYLLEAFQASSESFVAPGRNAMNELRNIIHNSSLKILFLFQCGELTPIC